MREISVDLIRDAVAALAVKANTVVDARVEEALKTARQREESPVGREILDQLLQNAEIARATATPICQDTGLAVVFVRVGQDVHLTGGSLEDAVNQGVAKGYTDGYLRKSVVRDPLDRINTKDNTPAIIHYEIVPGDELTITVAPKGIGSENMSRLYMLKPSQGAEGIRQAVLQTVREAGSNACPPLVIGVGVGGNFEKCALLAKRALLRPLGEPSPDPAWAAMERDLLNAVNDLGIGPQGLGGRVTALGLAIETYPTHIGGLPVAVNINCHVARHETVSL
ncbi:MAG: fumarate hydratase [Firmicutes bacterium]|nr:fumarate hydratase [Bacillota bacterium]